LTSFPLLQLHKLFYASIRMSNKKGNLNPAFASYTNPSNGARINLFTPKTDKGEADACRTSAKSF
jgi:hypothetical protein